LERYYGKNRDVAMLHPLTVAADAKAELFSGFFNDNGVLASPFEFGHDMLYFGIGRDRRMGAVRLSHRFFMG
jgi:hypothetical protein